MHERKGSSVSPQLASQSTTRRIGRESDGIRRISRREGSALLDRQARKYLGMSGESFRQQYRDGALDAEDARVIRVSFLLPLAER